MICPELDIRRLRWAREVSSSIFLRKSPFNIICNHMSRVGWLGLDKAFLGPSGSNWWSSIAPVFYSMRCNCRVLILASSQFFQTAAEDDGEGWRAVKQV